MQELVVDVEKKNKELTARNNALQMELNRLKRARKVKGSDGDDPDTKKLVKDIEKWGSHFFMFWNIIAPASAFLVSNIPSFDPEDPIRYSSPQNKLAGITADIYQVVPEKYHDILALDSSDAVQTVCTFHILRLNMC